MTGVQATIPENERLRMDAVRRYQVLDSPPDGAFDRITALAARIVGAPIAIVSVVDTDRIWFKSHHGLPDVTEIGRDPGLCASAILSDGPWVVTDAALDPRTLTNPLVAGDFGLRFYAGVPLATSDGFNLGTLCVLDTAPRTISADELACLEDLAAIVVDELELRLMARRVVSAEAHLRVEAEQNADALQSTLVPPTPPSVPGMDIAARFRPGEVGLQIGGDFFDVFRLGSNDWGIVLGDACGRGAAPAALASSVRWSVRTAAAQVFDPSEVLRRVNFTLLEDPDADAEADDRFCTALFARLELDTCGAWVTTANAGHPQPVLVRNAGAVALRGPVGLPLGLFPDFSAPAERIGLGPADFLVFYTDGITEARAADGSFFGDERLQKVLEQSVGASTAGDVADAVMAAAAHYATGEFSDDAAVLVIRVPGDAGDDPMARLVDATGTPADALTLPSYPHGSGG